MSRHESNAGPTAHALSWRPRRGGSRRFGALLCCSVALGIAGCSGAVGDLSDGSPPGRDAGRVSVDAAAPVDAGPLCPPDDSSALKLSDGNHIALGVVPELGLTEFTIEAWVRRDGPGTEAGTGVGGIRLVPIVAKGRGESDGSNVDTNYAFGFVGDVIGADFEDMASGANHPIVGRTPIAYGQWHHLAVTYDGATWTLYVDGLLDRRQTANAMPRADSIQPVGIGTTFNSTGARAGALDGAIDHVRIWDHARSEADIAAGAYAPPASLDGLIVGYALDESDGVTVRDVTGAHDGTITAPTYIAPGAPVERGARPVPTLDAPADGAEVLGESVELAIQIADEDSDDFLVTYYARPITEADDFTIVVLPDTQNYTRNGNEAHFYGQTQWIMDNAERYNIVAVLHNGDVINNADQRSQWVIADRAMATLDEPSAAFPDGMPTGVSIGNHDLREGLDVFNEWFGRARYGHRSYYGGAYRNNNNNDSYITFTGGGLEIVVVNLKWDEEPAPAVHAWARRIFESKPNSFGILNTHFLLRRPLGDDGKPLWSAQGRRIYDDFRDVQNLHLMTAGHISAERRRSDTFEGNTIHTMLADFQTRDEGGGGMMRIWEFAPAKDELTVRTYSPTQDVWERDADSEFTLSVDLSGAGAEFERIGRLEVAGETATFTMSGLAPGTVYEWYATVADCSHHATTPIRRFTTAP